MNIEVIEKKREAMRYTIPALCEEAGINKTTYYKWLENPDSMRLANFRKIAKVLKMTKAEQIQATLN